MNMPAILFGAMMRLRNLKRKLRRNFYDYGFFVCLKKSLLYVFGIFYKNEVQTIYAIDINKDFRTPSDNNHFIFKMVNPDDSEVLCQIEIMEEWLEGKLKSKLLTNGICFAFLDSARLIGFYLANKGDIIIPRLRLKLIMRPDEVWGEQITIHRDLRCKGLATDLKHRAYSELRNSGIKTIFGHSAAYNIASLKTVEKFHPNKAYKVNYLQIFNSNKVEFTEIRLCKNDRNIYTLLEYLKDRNWPVSKRIINRKKVSCFRPLKDKYVFTINTSEFF